MTNAFTIPKTSIFTDGPDKRHFVPRVKPTQKMKPMVLPNSSKFPPPAMLKKSD